VMRGRSQPSGKSTENFRDRSIDLWPGQRVLLPPGVW